MFFAMCALAASKLNNQTAHDLYLNHSTKVDVKDLQEIDEGTVLVTTTSIIQNRSLLGEKWTEITFKITYDLTHPDSVELIQNLGYNEFKAKGISLFNFLKIKSIGRKVYKFFNSEGEIDIGAEERLLDLNVYDDVNKVRHFYYRKVASYRTLLWDIQLLEMEKGEYEKNLEIMEKWDGRLKELLNAMSSDSDSNSDSNNEAFDSNSK